MPRQDIVSGIMRDASTYLYPRLGVIKLYPHTLQDILDMHIPEHLPQVTVTVEGGVVQNVAHPPNVEVIVRDYDTDNASVPLKTDEDGHEYVETIW